LVWNSKIETSRSGVLRRAAETGSGKLEVKSSDMKIRNSLKSLRSRHRDNRIIRRRGRLYIINKTNPRFKARQG